MEDATEMGQPAIQWRDEERTQDDRKDVQG